MATKKKVKQLSQYDIQSKAVTYIRVLDESSTYVVREGDGLQYSDSGETGQNHNIQGIEIVGKDRYYHIGVPFEINPNQTYYLVWVNYDTGDSFGRSGGQVDWIDLYKDKIIAEENAQRCSNATEYSIELCLDDGRSYTRSASWIGYFEHLNYVEVKPVCLNTQIKRYTGTTRY